jgi:hypothetical protein
MLILGPIRLSIMNDDLAAEVTKQLHLINVGHEGALFHLFIILILKLFVLVMMFGHDSLGLPSEFLCYKKCTMILSLT